MEVTLEVNGASRQVAENTTIAALLGELEINTRHVAVELNRQLIPRAQHASQTLKAGDELEVVTLVGGG